MLGKYEVRVASNKVIYDFTISRKYTVVVGDSGTGKSSLIDMLRDRRGINVQCKVDLMTLPVNKNEYEIILSGASNAIIFIDESVQDSWSFDFARLLKESDNYFVIFSRKVPDTLPVSISEIYHIKSSNKYSTAKVLYAENTFVHAYDDNKLEFKPDLVITEDSKFGHEYISKIVKCDCESADGKSNINKKLISSLKEHSNICIIVDGAAFGAQIADVLGTMHYASTSIVLLAPESFEYLLLNSGVVSVDKDVLINTYDYCDRNGFNSLIINDFVLGETASLDSWEQFYFYLLCMLTKDTMYQYTKGYSGSKNDENKLLYYLKFKDSVVDLLSDISKDCFDI